MSSHQHLAFFIDDGAELDTGIIGELGQDHLSL
jgi:hypothetical protein